MEGEAFGTSDGRRRAYGSRGLNLHARQTGRGYREAETLRGTEAPRSTSAPLVLFPAVGPLSLLRSGHRVRLLSFLAARLLPLFRLCFQPEESGSAADARQVLSRLAPPRNPRVFAGHGGRQCPPQEGVSPLRVEPLPTCARPRRAGRRPSQRESRGTDVPRCVLRSRHHPGCAGARL